MDALESIRPWASGSWRRREPRRRRATRLTRFPGCHGFAALTATMLALALAPRARAQTIVVGPGESGLTALPGGFVTVPVVADLTASGGALLGTLVARLSWRPGVVRFVAAGIGTAGVPTLAADTATGQLRFAVANAAGLTGTPVLVNATFQALGAPGDTMTFGLAVDTARSAGTMADLLPITTTTTAGFCVSPGRYGDLNGNDSLTSFDALLIVSSAVGLSVEPFTTLNGDVDGNGIVNTRDALIVLTATVGLPTAGFRVGQLNPGACTVRRAVSVGISPAGLSLAAGDQVPLAAVVRDSAGAVIGGQRVAWTARDTFVVRVDAVGTVTAIGLGTTRVIAVAAPGVLDSVTITVGGPRRVWYVNPALAAGNPVELGSSSLPFSRIQQAVDAAAQNDTVRIAAQAYGAGARITKPLVVIGDSTAFGFPRITEITGPAIVVDSIFLGAVRLSRLRLADAPGGLDARLVATLDLDRIVVDSSRSFGIWLHVAARSTLTDVAVNGASLVGVAADTVSYVGLSRVLVQGVSGPSGGPVFGLSVVVRGDTLLGDSVTIRGGVVAALAGDIALRNADLGGTDGPILILAGVRSIALDSVELSGGRDTGPTFIGDTTLAAVTLRAPAVTLRDVAVSDIDGDALHVLDAVTASFRDVVVGARLDSVGRQPRATLFGAVLDVRVAQSAFSGGRVEVLTNGAQARFDTTTFTNAPLRVDSAVFVSLRGTSLSGGDTVLARITNATKVSVATSRIALSTGTGLLLAGSDSVRLDSTVVVDNVGSGVEVSGTAILVGRHNFLSRNGTGLSTSGTVTMDSSRIEGNAVGVSRLAGTASLANNWWGHTDGPSCSSGCAVVAGDSVVGVVTFVPFLTAAPATPVGAPPVLPLTAPGAVAAPVPSPRGVPVPRPAARR